MATHYTAHPIDKAGNIDSSRYGYSPLGEPAILRSILQVVQGKDRQTVANLQPGQSAEVDVCLCTSDKPQAYKVTGVS